MEPINKVKKLSTKQLWKLLDIFTHKELKEMAGKISVPTGKTKTATIGSLVDNRSILSNSAIALDIS